MYNGFTNLLPPERQRAFRRDYFIRLGVVVLELLTFLIIAATVLLLPAYLFLTKSANAENERLASIESSYASFGEATLTTQLTSLSNRVAVLTALSSSHSVSAIMNNVLAVSRPGIILSSFSYTSGTGKNPSTFAISGTAVTRDALRNYQLAIQVAPFARSANLPVSAYAKDADIAFTITITLAP